MAIDIISICFLLKIFKFLPAPLAALSICSHVPLRSVDFLLVSCKSMRARMAHFTHVLSELYIYIYIPTTYLNLSCVHLDYPMDKAWLIYLFILFFACREASNSILTFLSDTFDLQNSSKGEQYLPIRDAVIIPRGVTVTRILIASLTGALPSSRLEQVVNSYIISQPSVPKPFHC